MKTHKKRRGLPRRRVDPDLSVSPTQMCRRRDLNPHAFKGTGF